MSSLTAQESARNQPDLPVNQGTTTQTGPGKTDASLLSKLSEERKADRSPDASTVQQTNPGDRLGSGASGAKRGGYLKGNGEGGGNAQERGEMEHSRALGGDEGARGGTSEGEKKRTKPRWTDIHFE